MMSNPFNDIESLLQEIDEIFLWIQENKNNAEINIQQKLNVKINICIILLISVLDYAANTVGYNEFPINYQKGNILKLICDKKRVKWIKVVENICNPSEEMTYGDARDLIRRIFNTPGLKMQVKKISKKGKEQIIKIPNDSQFKRLTLLETFSNMNPDEHEIFAHTFIDPNKLISGHKDIDSIYVDSETNDGLMDVFQQINNNETVLHALKYLRNKVVHVELSRSKKQNIQFALKNDIRSPIASNIHIECIDCTDGNGDMFNYVNPKTLAEAQEKGCMIEEENIVMLDMSDFHEDPSSQRFQDIKNAIEGKPIDEFLEEAIKSVKRIFKQMKDHFPSISSCS